METNCRVGNYYNHKRKWIEVGFFATEPQDWPRASKELRVTAKFIALGDAFVYAQALAKSPEASHWFMVAIR